MEEFEKYKKEEIIDELLTMLAKENGIKFNHIPNYEKENLLNILLLAKPLDEYNDYIINTHNKLLNLQDKEDYLDTNTLKFKSGVCEVDENFFRIKSDLGVYFSNNLVEENNYRTSSIDNLLILKNGLTTKEQLCEYYKNDLYKIDYKKPYIVETNNLYYKYVVKIMFPKIKEFVSLDENNIKSALENLFNNSILKEIKTISIYLKNLQNEFGDKIVLKIEKEIKNQIKNKKLKNKFIFIKKIIKK